MLTNKRGEFRFAGLPPGEYFVRISPSDSVEQRNYPQTFFPNATDPADAAKLVISDGNELSGNDVHIYPSGIRLSGKFALEDRTDLSQRFFLLPRNPRVLVPSTPSRVTILENDRFEIRGVPAGSYYLYVLTRERGNGIEWVRSPVEVNAAEVSNLSIVGTAAGSLKIRVLLDPDAKDAGEVDFSDLRLTMRSGKPYL